MTLYAERKPSRHRPFAIIETRGSGKDMLGYDFFTYKDGAPIEFDP